MALNQNRPDVVEIAVALFGEYFARASLARELNISHTTIDRLCNGREEPWPELRTELLHLMIRRRDELNGLIAREGQYG